MRWPPPDSMFRSTTVAVLVIWVLASGISLGARGLGLFQRFELSLLDGHVRQRVLEEPPTSTVLVQIRERDIDRFGYPLNDGLLARVLETIARGGARSIGVDLFRPDPVPPGREALSRVAAEHGVILIEKLDAGGLPGVRAPEFLARSQVGFADMPLDIDGVIRRALLIAWDEADRPGLSLAFAVTLDALREEGLALGPDPLDPDGLAIGGRRLPYLDADFGGYVGEDDRGYQILIDFARARDAWTRVGFGDVIDGALEDDVFRDKIVLVGTTAASVKDLFATPRSGHDGEPVFGVAIHAQIVDQLLRTARGLSRPIRAGSEASEVALVLLAALLGTGLGVAGRNVVLQVLGLLVAGALLFATARAAHAADLWIPIVPSGTGFVIAGGLGVAFRSQRERAEKKQIRGLFGRFAPPGVVDLLWAQRARLLEGGRPRPVELPVTVMMVDLAGSTQAIHELSLGEATRWVDRYMDAIVPLVLEAGGAILEYGGDGFKADFGVPVPRSEAEEVESDARAAIGAALAMGRRVEALNGEMKAEGLPTAQLRVGLCSGVVVASGIGVADAMRYTTIGDAANLAAHIEALEKEGFRAEGKSWRVLASESTCTLVKTRSGSDFEIVPFGTHTLKGVDVPVFRVFGEPGDT